MKIKNVEKFQADIAKAKKIKNVSERAAAKRKIAEAHGISYSNFCKEYKKKVPGVAKTRSDYGIEKNKVTAKEKKIMAELSDADIKQKDAAKIIELHTGKPVSKRKLDKLSKAVSELPDTEGNKTTNFGGDAKEYLEKQFKVDLIAPERGVMCTFGKGVNQRKGFITREAIQDIILILAHELNKSADERGMMKFDRMQYMKTKIIYLLDDLLIQAQKANDVKKLNTITLMYQRLETNYGELSPDLKTVIAVVKDFKPTATVEEIFSSIEKHSK